MYNTYTSHDACCLKSEFDKLAIKESCEFRQFKCMNGVMQHIRGNIIKTAENT